jgi:hypothetical protein
MPIESGMAKEVTSGTLPGSFGLTSFSHAAMSACRIQTQPNDYRLCNQHPTKPARTCNASHALVD